MRWLLLVLVAACSHPPEAPRPPPIAAPTNEEALFDEVKRIYVEAGYPEAADAILDLEDDTLIPYTAIVRIHAPHFLAAGERMRTHLAKVSKTFYGGRLATDDTEAYLAFMTTLLGHELAHSITAQRAPFDRPDWWLEEKRAMTCERPVLVELVRRGKVPASWVAALDRFDRILLAAAPPNITAQLPVDLDGRRDLFARDYMQVLEGMGAAMSTGVHPHAAAVDHVLALYSVYRLELARQPPQTLAAQLDTFPARHAKPAAN